MSRPLTTMFVDLNAYFASVEQHLRPELRGRPVGIAPMVAETTCCIAVSYEAKRHGVKTGTGVREARRLCPEIAIVPARPREYIVMHHRVLAAADTVLPVDAVHSVDEFSVLLMGRERDRSEAERLAREMKRAIRDQIGETMRCSIGIAPNRMLAKLGTDMQKPDGLVVIESKDLPGMIGDLEVTAISGVGPRMGERLRGRGIETIGQLWTLSIAEMGAIWGGVTGKIMHQRLRGEEPDTPPVRKGSIGHQHVLAPRLRTPEGARAVMVRLTHKAAARLRHEGYWTRRVSVSVVLVTGRGWGADTVIPETQDTLTILEVGLALWDRMPAGTPLQIGVVLMDLAPHAEATAPLFPGSVKRLELARAMDRITRSYGHDAVYFAGMHGAKDSAPMRIPFQSIPHLDLPDVHEIGGGIMPPQR